MPLDQLLDQLEKATGADKELDRVIAETFGIQTTDSRHVDYTSSVDHTIDLVHQVLPGWSWHVGFSATGILPYASLHVSTRRFEAAGPTVPLALLKALTKAKLTESG